MCDGCRMLYYVFHSCALDCYGNTAHIKKWAKMMIMRKILPVNILYLVQWSYLWLVSDLHALCSLLILRTTLL